MSMNHTSSPAEARFPQSLCDALAIRADTLPRSLNMRVKALVSYCEGKLLYEPVRKGKMLFVTWGDERVLWMIENHQLPFCSTVDEFQRQYAPEHTLLQQVKGLLLQDSQKLFDAGLEATVQSYLNTPSPREERKQLVDLLLNRGKSCPPFLKGFLGRLVTELYLHDYPVPENFEPLSEWAAKVVKVTEAGTSEIKNALAKDYAHEVKLVKGCLAASNLENDAFDHRIWELLRDYAAVRINWDRRFQAGGECTAVEGQNK